MGQGDKRDNAGSVRGINALAPEQIGERAANQTDRHDRHGRDEKIEKPWALI
jgi:hypothetical protein